MSDDKLGRKFDNGKPRMALLPPYALEEVAKVLTAGSIKYADNNWKYVENGESRYKDAMFRHINAFNKGEVLDPETGMHHLAHAICCAMFIVDAHGSGVPLASKAASKVEGAFVHVQPNDMLNAWRNLQVGVDGTFINIDGNSAYIEP